MHWSVAVTSDDQALGCEHCGHPLIIVQTSIAFLSVDTERRLGAVDRDVRAFQIECTNREDRHVAARWTQPLDAPISIDAVNDQLTLAALKLDPDTGMEHRG